MGNYLEGCGSCSANWTITIIFWTTTVFVSIFSKDFRKGLKNHDSDKLSHCFAFWLEYIVYFIYLILQFSKTGFRKFIKIHEICKILKINIENTFEIKFHGKAWHEVTDTDSHGNTTTRDVVTFNEKKKYEFKSGADCSKIIIDSNDINNKRYLDLEIEIEEICVDEKTKNEFKTSYDEFYERTRKADDFFSVKKKIKIPNAHSKNIITLSNSYIIILDRIIYIICIFLSLGQIYKIIISCFMSKKKIIITKVISNYYDLTSGDSFFNIQPYVNLFGEYLEYQRNLYTFKNSSDRLEFILSEKNQLNTELKLNDFHEDITYNLFNEDNEPDENNDNSNKLEMEKLIKQKP